MIDEWTDDTRANISEEDDSSNCLSSGGWVAAVFVGALLFDQSAYKPQLSGLYIYREREIEIDIFI